ncbi:MAG: tetratricopeptide repeat protein [Bacteroidia bacterium]|nr:tetratricopeptide repeat protein [Bacteroidia bacterium]
MRKWNIYQTNLLWTSALLFSFCQPAQGVHSLDSLWQVVNTSRDSNQVYSLQELAKLYMNDSTSYAIELAERSLRISREQGFRFGEALAYEKLGIAYDILGKTNAAIDFYDQGLAILEEIHGSPERITAMHINKGVAYYYAGEFGKAIEFYTLAKDIAIEHHLDAELSYLLNNLGVVYRSMDKYEDALSIYKQSLDIKTRMNDLEGMANTEHNIGSAYVHLANQAEAMEHYERAKGLFLQIGDSSEALSVTIALGTGYAQLGKLSQAKILLEETLANPQLRVTEEDIVQGNISLANIYFQEGQYDLSLKLLLDAERRMASTNRQLIKANILLPLSKTYAALGNTEKAYAYLQSYLELYQELHSEERQKLQEEMEAKYSNQEKTNQIQLQQLELDKERKLRIGFIGGITSLLLIATLLFWTLRSRSLANQELERKNQQIKKTLGEKEILMREIHHRVKNNLQVISSLLSLQSRNIEDPKALEVMKEGRNRVKSMALIHQNLYQDENLVGIDTVDYIEKLTKSLVSSYQVNEGNIKIHIDVDQIDLDVDVIIPLGLILNELISNSLKYAFPNKQEGSLHISLKQQDDWINLEVADNGIGMPQGFDLASTASLGMFLISSFSKKLNASFDLISGPGTAVRLRIPVTNLSLHV